MSDHENNLLFYAERHRVQERAIRRLQEDNAEMRKTLAYIADHNSGIWGGAAFETLQAIRKRNARP